MSKLRIGMVGLGFITDWHFQAFASLDGIEFAGLCQDFHGDENQIAAKKKQLQNKCDELKIKAYGSYSDLISDSSINAVIIGSINPYHYDQIIAGLHAGKHLLVEKPVVTDLAQIASIETLSRQKGLVVFPGHNFVYRGAVQRAKTVLESGQLGRTLSSFFVATHAISDRAAGGWRSKKILSNGGALMDSGHHLVYQVLYLLGLPRSVQAFTAKMARAEMEGEDTAQMSLQYADGSVCSVMQSWASSFGANGFNDIRILGDKGSLVISDTLYLNGEKQTGDADYGSSFANQARAFVEAIVSKKSPVSSLADVANTLKLIYAAYESAETNRVVQLA